MRYVAGGEGGRSRASEVTFKALAEQGTLVRQECFQWSINWDLQEDMGIEVMPGM